MPSTRRKKYLVAPVIILACLGLWWMLSQPKHEVRYTVTDLSPIRLAVDINNLGQVLGQWGLVWSSKNGITSIQESEETQRLKRIHGQAINDHGQVAGIARDTSGECQRFIWNATGGFTWLGKDSCIQKVPSAVALNNLGKLVWSTREKLETGWSKETVWTWDSLTGKKKLSSGAERFNSVTDINDSGICVGWAEKEKRAHSVGAFGRPREELTLVEPPPGYYWIHLYSINNKGQMVGYILNEKKEREPVIWNEGEFTLLGNLGGRGTGQAKDVNEQGQVVGRSRGLIGGILKRAHYALYGERRNPGKVIDSIWKTLFSGAHRGRRAFIWENGLMTDLNHLIPTDSGWELWAANAINESGQIIGGGELDGKRHAFLLTPIEDKTEEQ